MRRLAGNVLALAFATALSLAAGEAALRPVVALPLPRVDPEVRYLPHPVRRFSLRPNQSAFSYGAPVTVDARGFRRNGAVPGPSEDAETVLALGDSFTFGLGVRDEETWPAQLERRLRGRRPPVRVVNAGTISYGVFQEMDLLKERGLTTHPALVIHGLYWNDFMSAGPPEPEESAPLTPDGHFVWDRPVVRRDPVRHAVSWLFANSALFFSVRQAVSRLDDAGGDDAYARAYQQFLVGGLTDEEWQPVESFFRELIALGAQRGFKTLVVIMPVNDIVFAPSATAHPFAVEARRRLEGLGIPFVDGFALWPDGAAAADAFLPQGPDSHLNAAGYRRLAAAIAPSLLP